MKLIIYHLLKNSTEVLISFIGRERTSLTLQLYVLTDTRENFVSTNLYSRHLSKDKISLLLKELKFVPTPKHLNKAKIKEEIEAYGRKFRLMWYFRNDEQELDVIRFKKKSKFNSKSDAAIETYLNSLEEDILSLEKKIIF